MVKTFRISNINGQWYKDNDEWGPLKELAEVYESATDLPDEIKADDGETCLMNDWNDETNIYYYRESEADSDETYASAIIEKPEWGEEN
jgi:hypothetical protein